MTMNTKETDLESLTSLTSPEDDSSEMYVERILRNGRRLPDAIEIEIQSDEHCDDDADGAELDLLERQVLARKEASPELFAKLVCDEVRIRTLQHLLNHLASDFE
jgi:hypothetical protein